MNQSTKKTVELTVPYSFGWVIEYMKKWREENKTGEIKLVYHDGGITKIVPANVEHPPKKI